MPSDDFQSKRLLMLERTMPRIFKSEKMDV